MSATDSPTRLHTPSSPQNLSPLSRKQLLPMDHQFQPASWISSRAPCPALNALANHGYIPRSGTRIPFFTLFGALRLVYNLSLPLTLILVIPTYLMYGKLSFFRPKPMTEEESWMQFLGRHVPRPTYTLDLASLAAFGPRKITHPASFVHPNKPSYAPEPALLRDVLSRAKEFSTSSDAPLLPPLPALTLSKLTLEGESDMEKASPASTPTKESTFIFEESVKGFSLPDLAQIRVDRERDIVPPQKLDGLHIEIALGESALVWIMLRKKRVPEEAALDRRNEAESYYIPYSRLAQWLGEEQLPDGWFETIRPKKVVGLVGTRKVAAVVRQLMEDIRTNLHAP